MKRQETDLKLQEPWTLNYFMLLLHAPKSGMYLRFCLYFHFTIIMRTYQSFYCRQRRRPTSKGRKISRALQVPSKADPPSQPAVRKSVRFEVKSSVDAEEQLVQAESRSLDAISEEDEAVVSLDLTNKITEDKNIDPKFPPKRAQNIL